MEPRSCPACEGSGEEVGTLGRRAHYRCRQCGMEFSVLEDAPELEEPFGLVWHVRMGFRAVELRRRNRSRKGGT